LIGKRIWWLGVALASTVGCTAQSPPGSWWSPTTSPTGPPTAVTNISLQPRALNGGGLSQATVSLNQPAAGATTITLSASDPSAVLPVSVTVPSGATTATFPIATSPVSADSIVTIGTSVSGKSYKAALALWRIAPNSFWYDLTPNGAFAHFTTENAAIQASCTGSRLEARINNFDWTATFSAIQGEPLRPGTYATGARFATGSPWLYLSPQQCSSFGSSSDPVGQFVVEEVDLAPRGDVRRFVSTFELRCADGSNTIRGEIRLANPPNQFGSSLAPTCYQ